jgi:hypothetical protein
MLSLSASHILATSSRRLPTMSIHMLDIRKSGFCITNLGHFFGRFLLSVDDRVSFLINLLFSASVTYRLSADVPEMAIRFDLM